MDGPPPEEYEVEAIFGARKIGRLTQYLVQWVGWPLPTWEPAANLTNCTELIEQFLQEQAERSARHQARTDPSHPPDFAEIEHSLEAKEDLFWALVDSDRIFVSPGGFVGHEAVDTSDVDENWYHPPPPLPVGLGRDLHIDAIVNRDGIYVVRFSGPNGTTAELDYVTVTHLFPAPLTAFLEKELVRLL
jgi:hypothetical protein